MAGSIHPVQTVELLVALRRCGYDRAIYFDTFPDTGGLDPVAECGTNIETIERLRKVAAVLAEDERLAQAIARHDATVCQRIVASALYGTGG